MEAKSPQGGRKESRVFVLVIVVLVLIFAVGSATLPPPSPSLSQEITGPGSVVVRSTSGLNLSLSLGSTVINPGQAVSVYIDEWNTLPSENSVP